MTNSIENVSAKNASVNPLNPAIQTQNNQPGSPVNVKNLVANNRIVPNNISSNFTSQAQGTNQAQAAGQSQGSNGQTQGSAGGGFQLSPEILNLLTRLLQMLMGGQVGGAAAGGTGTGGAVGGTGRTGTGGTAGATGGAAGGTGGTNGTGFAVNDTASTPVNTPTNINVLGNDTNISVTGFTQPANGTVSQQGNNLVYTPNSGFQGSDSFNYTNSTGASAKVDVHVCGTGGTGASGASGSTGSVGVNNTGATPAPVAPAPSPAPAPNQVPAAPNQAPAAPAPTPVPNQVPTAPNQAPAAPAPTPAPNQVSAASASVPTPAPEPTQLPGYKTSNANIDASYRALTNGTWEKIYGQQFSLVDKGDYLHMAPEAAGMDTRHNNAGHVTSWNPEGKPVVISPVAVDLNNDGQISTTGSSTAKDRADNSIGKTVNFDMDVDGSAEAIEWMSGDGDALLVDNRDGNAANSMDGSRLFGDMGGKFNNGYEKMAQLDADGNGQLAGAELDGLELWVDNGNARVDAGEMRSLAEFGLTTMSVNKQDNLNARGESLMQSSAGTADGRSVLTEDVWFARG